MAYLTPLMAQRTGFMSSLRFSQIWWWMRLIWCCLFPKTLAGVFLNVAMDLRFVITYYSGLSKFYGNPVLTPLWGLLLDQTAKWRDFVRVLILDDEKEARCPHWIWKWYRKWSIIHSSMSDSDRRYWIWENLHLVRQMARLMLLQVAKKKKSLC